MMQFCKHGVPLGVCTLCDKDNLKPQWQGLMDDEIDAIKETIDYGCYPVSFARAIEAKLKEKNL